MPSVDLYRSLNIVPVEKLIKIRSVLHLVKEKKMLSVEIPLSKGSDIHEHNTRRGERLRSIGGGFDEIWREKFHQ